MNKFDMCVRTVATVLGAILSGTVGAVAWVFAQRASLWYTTGRERYAALALLFGLFAAWIFWSSVVSSVFLTRRRR